MHIQPVSVALFQNLHISHTGQIFLRLEIVDQSDRLTYLCLEHGHTVPHVHASTANKKMWLFLDPF